MQVAEAAIDLWLGLMVLLLGWLVLSSRDFLRAAVFFLAFGIFMSLAWVRLQAPDIALAEAAIGAGITGVLLMDALRHMEWERRIWGERWPRSGPVEPRLPRLQKAGTWLAVLLLLALLLAGVREMAEQRPGLAGAAGAEMEKLEHPVTAVLLVFRSLDTWLELAILLLAVLGMLAARERNELAAEALAPPHDPVLQGVVRVLTPLAVLCAAYLVWLGTFTAGGAFQSGVVLGAVGILLWMSGPPSIEALPAWLWKLLVLLGVGVFSLAALITTLWSGVMLRYPEPLAALFIQAMELAAAISIGACFVALFIGMHPQRGSIERAGDGKKAGKETP